MNPVTLETVTDPLIYTIGKIGFALAIALAIAFILIVFIRREKNSDKLVNWFAVIALGTTVVFGVMAAIGVEIYNNDREEAAEAALSAVEDTNGVTLLEADEITYKSLQRPNNIIPVTIDLDGNLLDGRLRIDDNGSITLLAPNSQDAAIMIPFEKEEYLAAEVAVAEEEEARVEEAASRSQARPAPTIDGKTILHFGQPGLLPPAPGTVPSSTSPGSQEAAAEDASSGAETSSLLRYKNGNAPQDVAESLTRPGVSERVFRSNGQ